MSFDLPRATIDKLLHESADRAMEHWPGSLLHASESPIEHMFLLAAWARGCWIEQLDFVKPHTSVRCLTDLCAGNPKIFCSQQVEVGPYRVDFLFVSARADNEPPCYVVVECDGHDFHEKTKEQAARDKARDRELTSRGMTVMRFTGSEIWRDPGGCAQDVLYYLGTEWADSSYRMIERNRMKAEAA